MQASPLHLLDCCLVTDGAGAFVMTVGRAAPRTCQGAGVRARRGDRGDHALDDPDARSGHHTWRRLRARRVRAWPASRRADVDVLETYDSFTITALLHLEDLGFCAQGRGRSVRRGRQHRSGRRAPDEHQRRRPVVHASGPVRHVHPRRGGASVAGRVWRSPGRRRRGRHRPRLGRVSVDIVDVGTSAPRRLR